MTNQSVGIQELLAARARSLESLVSLFEDVESAEQAAELAREAYADGVKQARADGVPDVDMKAVGLEVPGVSARGGSRSKRGGRRGRAARPVEGVSSSVKPVEGGSSGGGGSVGE